MPYFPVDDGFYSHPKRFACDDHAIALWVIAGSWCADKLTDGFVPDRMVIALGFGCDAAEQLEAATLWERDDARAGWRFHEWHGDERSVRNASAQDVVAGQKQKIAGAKYGNHVRWHVKKGRFNSDCEFCASATSAPSHSESHSDTEATPKGSLSESLRIAKGSPNTNTNTNKDVTHLSEASHASNARENEPPPRGRPVKLDAWKLVNSVIPAEHPQAVRAGLAIRAQEMLGSGTPGHTIREALELWLAKNLGPGALPSLVSEVIKNRSPAAARANRSPADERVAQAQTLKTPAQPATKELPWPSPGTTSSTS